MTGGHLNDGIEEISHSLLLACGAIVSYLKIVDPILPAWVGAAIAAAIFLLSVGLRRLSPRKPRRVRLLWLVALPVMIALLVRWGILPVAVIVPAIAGYLGGMQVLRSEPAAMARTRALAILSFAIAMIVTWLGDPVLDRIFLWSAGAAVLYLVVGLWVLSSSFRVNLSGK